MFLTLEHRFAFVHIPKTAGEQLFQIFVNGILSKSWYPPLNIAYWGQDAHSVLDITHLHQDVLYQYIPEHLYNECVSFCVVRNPYNRFYSAFGDLPSKIAYCRRSSRRTPNPHPFWIEKYPEYPNPKASNVNAAEAFVTFCQIIDSRRIPTDTVTKHNIHVIPQHRFVYRANGSKNVKEVLRFEQLHKELPALFIKHKLPFVRNTHFTNRGKKWNQRRVHFNDLDVSRLSKSYLSKFTPSSIALVNKWYKRDFEAFGYDMIDPTSFEVPASTITPLRKSKKSSRKTKRRRR